MSTRGWKEVRHRRTSCDYSLVTNRVPFCILKKTVFLEIWPLNGNFSGMWNHMSWDATWTRVCGKFGRNRSKESGKSGAWFTSQKNNGSATHFFALCPKPIARFRSKRARLSHFRPQHHMPSFIQIHPSFPDLLAKTTFHRSLRYTADNKLRVHKNRPGIWELFEKLPSVQVKCKLCLKELSVSDGATSSMYDHMHSKYLTIYKQPLVKDLTAVMAGFLKQQCSLHGVKV